MKFTIFTQDNCVHCDAVVIPEGINAEKINISDKDFNGFIPSNLPVMQFEGMNFEGPVGINIILKLVNDAKNGEYNK